MSQRINDFLTSIEYDKQNEESIKQRLLLKGCYHFELIRDYLKSLNESLDFELIFSIYIYDKRLRQLLVKYITMVEEYFRAKLINDNKMNDDENVLKLTFQRLIARIKEYYPDEYSNEDFNNLNAIRELRNQIFHCQFILLSKKDSKVEKNKILIKQLNSLDKSLIFEPNIRNQFHNDINEIHRKPKQTKYNDNLKLKSIIEDLKITSINGKFKFSKN